MKTSNQLDIKTIEDLHKEISLVKERILIREEKLIAKLSEIPGEAVKSVVESILPIFLGTELASGAWKLIRGVFDLFSGKSANSHSNDDWKSTMAGGAKKLGIFTVFKLLYQLWKSK